ncbi:zinc ABC transporter substrate-binding protein [Prauserella halophila]|uniref:Zinc ABC transporter substrate-binding protein n=1 Tax=Prauserella halophila TaxID=185641 RepID=A0ABN1W695_9PSEU|nr:zinc ABC transporter substrate-binding protein [Prauserella halophila]MCP2235527.1 zinc/manganese transport system substrate-binding protein [Prauserella halophila]
MNKARVFTAMPLAAALVAATACGGSGGDSGGSGDDSAITVVASTNVWGAVAKAVGGDRVEVNSLIDDPSSDPHSYEATAEDAADVQDSDLLVYNGGGYDDFFTQLVEQATDKRSVVAVPDDGGGHQHGHGGHGGDGAESGEHGDEGDAEHGHEGHSHGDGDNEHVWYDPEAVGELADEVAQELAEIEPGQKQTFTDNAAEFTKRLEGLEQKIAGTSDGRVVATAPVAHYLLTGAGLEDVTPPEYMRAIANETDVPVAAQQQVTSLVEGGQVDAVINNPQTVTSVTEKLVNEADGADVPVVDMTETLPEGQDDYIAWMTGQIDALAGALGQ